MDKYKTLLQNLFLQQEIKISLIPEEFLLDKSFVLKLIKVEAAVYFILNEEFINDYEICISVAKSNYKLFDSLPPIFTTDKKFILESIHSALDFSIIFEIKDNKEFLKDENFIETCIKNNFNFLFYLIENGLYNQEFLILAIKYHPTIINYFSPEEICKEKFLKLIDFEDPEIFFNLRLEIQKKIFCNYFFKSSLNKKRKITN